MEHYDTQNGQVFMITKIMMPRGQAQCLEIQKFGPFSHHKSLGSLGIENNKRNRNRNREKE